MKSPSNIKVATKNLLKEFSQSSTKVLNKGELYKKNLSGDYDLWRLARFIFSEILSIKVSDQPFEKINWFISFVYEDKYSCSISHEKFGFRLYVYNGENEDISKKISEEIEVILLKSLSTIVPLVEQYARDALSKGDVIVENRFKELFRPYDYFRRMAEIKKKLAQKPKSLTTSKKPKKTVLWRAYSSVQYYEQATYFFFFSLLEHVCVLFLAYRDLPERENVAQFSNMKWGDKFKTVFDIKKPEFKKFYDNFIGLARYRRNPTAHGYAHTAFSFYLEGARHKINCMLSDKDIALQWQEQEDNFMIMESFLKLLNTDSSTKNIFMYLEAGMNVSFSKEGKIQNNMVANMSDEEIKEYIAFMVRRYDDSANMDW